MALLRQDRALRLTALLFVCGVAYALLGLPRAARNTYVSENALLPGSAWVHYSDADARAASALSADLRANASAPVDWALAAMPRAGLAAVGAWRWPPACDPRAAWPPTAASCAARAAVGLVRSARGDGKEAVALAVRFDPADPWASSDAAGAALSLASLLARQRWLAKDVVVALLEGSDAAVPLWLADPRAPGSPAGASALQEALVLRLSRAGGAPGASRLAVLVDGANGQLPNLDLLNSVARVAAREGVPESQLALTRAARPCSEAAGRVAAWAARADALLREALAGAGVGQGLGPLDVGRLETMLGFVERQARGLPSGDHAHFNRRRVDSVTLDLVAADPWHSHPGVVTYGRIVVGTIRCLSNVVERLHQSYFFYLLFGPTKFLSIGEYTVALGLIVSPLAAVLVVPVLSGERVGLSARGILQSLLDVIFPYICAGISYATSFYVFPMGLFPQWAVASVSAALLCSLAASGATGSPPDARALRLFVSAPLAVFLTTCSVVNFSFALLAAVLSVPLVVLLTPPVPPLPEDPRTPLKPPVAVEAPRERLGARARLGVLARLLCAVAASPAVLLPWAASQAGSTAGEAVAQAFREHAEYGTAAFPFLVLLYAPISHCCIVSLAKTLLSS
eukprot:m51a1_g9084 putative glycosylphosphatidylinositol anchor attachment (628) ;mRNA; f:34272-36281